MIIKELYIENFGKLSEYRLKLNRSFNSIVQKNGYGKTTLAAFIRAMLYGLDDNRKLSLLENLRKRYTPWQGGSFGGWLIYEEGGEDFRIERSFGQKASQDVCTLTSLKTGRELSVSEHGIGQMLFDIDAEGFENTVFLSEHNVYRVGGGDAVSAKLAGITGVEGDIGEFDSAIELLDKRRRFYQKKGGSGEIRDTEERIHALTDRLAELDKIREVCLSRAARIAEIDAALTEGRSKLSAVRESMLAADKEAARIGFTEEYERKLERLRAEEKKQKEALAFFENGFPDATQIADFERRLTEGKRLTGQSCEKLDTPPDIPCPFARIPTADEISAHTMAVSAPKKKTNPRGLSISLLPAGLAVLFAVLGVTVAPWLFALAAASAGIALLLLGKLGYEKSDAEGKARAFADEVYGRSSEGQILPLLITMRAELQVYLDAKSAAEANAQRADGARIAERKRGAELIAQAEAFLAKFPAKSENPFEEIRRRLFDYSYVCESANRLREECRSFAQEHGIGTEPSVPLSTSSAELAVQSTELSESITALENERYLLIGANAEDEARGTDRAALEAQLSELCEKLRLYRENLEVITKASALLSLARSNMTSRYLDKTRERFEYYTAKIDGVGGEFIMDTEFSVKKTEAGASRDTSAYSRGTRELYLLATRLALIDSLYGKAAPPIILDDPFIAFDDENVARAVKLLQSLADEGRQIIYFSCSESRA